MSFVAVFAAGAQAGVLVSNSGQSVDNVSPAGASWDHAQGFETGANATGYTLASIGAVNATSTQHEIWSATLTVAGITALGSTFGYGFVDAMSEGSLSEEEFTYYGTEYSIELLFHYIHTDPSLLIGFDPSGETAFDSEELSLVVDGTAISFGDAEFNDTNQFVWDLTGLSWAGGDTVAVSLLGPPPPPLVSATVSGTVLTLTYDADMDEGSVPAASAYAVDADGAAAKVSSVAVAGAEVTLTLASAPASTATVTVDYAVPVTNPLRSLPGAIVPAFAGQPVAHVVDLVGNRSKAAAAGISDPDGATQAEAGSKTLSDLALEDADGAAITLSSLYGGGFKAAAGTYTASVAGTVSSVTVTATPSDSGATVVITDDDDTSTATTAALDLVSGANTIVVTVTATGGETMTYTVTLTRGTAPGAAVPKAAVPKAAATGKPAITGPAQVGMTLTAGMGDIADTDGLPSTFPDDYTFEWIAGGATITGATNSTYTLTSAEAGDTITVRASFTDDASNAEERTSDSTTAVVPAAVACPMDTLWCSTLTVGYGRADMEGGFSLGLATGIGTPPESFGSLDTTATFTHLGQTFTVTQFIADADSGNSYFGTSPNLPADGAGLTLHVQQVSGQRNLPLSGFTLGTSAQLPTPAKLWRLEYALRPTSSDPLTAPLLRGFGRAYDQYQLYSDEDTEVTVWLSVANHPAEGAPTISGTPQVGATLTADPSSITDADGLTGASYTYRWIRVDGGTETPISGATSDTYDPVAADVGRQVKVEATFTDGGGNAETLVSGAYPPGGTIIAAVVGSVSVRFGSSTYSATEGGSVTLTVQLSEAPASPATILLTRRHLHGATAADYSGVPPSVTFGASDTSKTFTLTATDDSVDDDGESVKIGFGTLPPGVVTGSPATATVSLVDNDVAGWEPPTVSFGAARYTATEGGGAVTVTVEVDRAEVPFTLRLTREGQGGAASSDYSGVPASVVFRESDTAKSFTVTAVDDEVDDDGESVVIGFGSPLPAGLSLRIGSPSRATVRLVDNDAPKASGALRLAQGGGVYGGSYGQLQVYHDGQWGLVCEGNFGREEAQVACRQLGFADGEESYGGAGSGGLPFWLKGVKCAGTESRLVGCSHRGLQEHYCGSFDIAGVECSETPLSTANAYGAYVKGALLTLRYDAALDGGSTPSGGDFVVFAGPPGSGSAVPVTAVSVGGDTVALTLARPVLPDEAVRLSYLVAPMHPVQDASGVPAAPLPDMAVRNETPPSTAGAAVSPAEIGGLAAHRPPLDLSPWLADGGASAPLRRLDLSSRAVTDLSALAGLTELRVLNLSGNAVADLAPLAGLTGLRVLDLSSNAVVDVGPLAGLTGLKRLDLSGNRIADVSALSGLTRLEVLRLNANRIDDALPLWSLQGLVHLGLSDNRITDVQLLAELRSLQRLDLTANAVLDVSPLGALSELVWLRLPGNPVSDVSHLGRLTGLRWLWLGAAAAGVGTERAGAALWIGREAAAPNLRN